MWQNNWLHFREKLYQRFIANKYKNKNDSENKRKKYIN